MSTIKTKQERQIKIDADEILQAIEKLAKADSENLTKFLYDNTHTLMRMHEIPAVDALELLLAIRLEIVQKKMDEYASKVEVDVNQV
jgi:hypothetical protein